MLVNKHSILQLVEKEIDKLSEQYNSQIQRLTKQISELQEENQQLKLEVQTRQNHSSDTNIDYQKRYETLITSPEFTLIINYELIDEWFLSSNTDDVILLLTVLNHILEEGQHLDKAIYIFELLELNTSPLELENEKIKALFMSCLEKILIQKHIVFAEVECDELYSSFLKLILKLRTTNLESEIQECIWENFYKIIDNICTVQSPVFLTGFLRTCMYFNLKKEIPNLFNEIFESELWETFEEELIEENFIFLLWYAFIFDFDEQLIEQATSSLQWLDEKKPNFSLYFYLYDYANGKVIHSLEEYQKLAQEFMNCSVLTNMEKEAILGKADSIFKKYSQIPKLQSTVDIKPHERVTKNLYQLNNYAKSNSYHFIADIMNALQSDADAFNNNQIKKLMPILRHVFKTDFDDLTLLDQTYQSALALIQQFKNNHDVKTFLMNNKEMMMEKVLDSNEPSIINELVKIYSIFDLEKILIAYLKKIIDQWSFLDANIDLSSFLRLFWYTVSYNLENKLIPLLEESANYLSEDIPEAKIYMIYQDETMDPGKKLKQIEHLKKDVSLFEKKEADKIFNFFQTRMKIQELTANSNQPSDVRKMSYVVKLPTELPILPDTNEKLTEEWIQLAFFNDALFNSRPQYAQVKVLSNHRSGKAYVTSAHLQEIKSKIGLKKFVDVHSYLNATKKKEEKSFMWPSTELTGNTTEEIQEKGTLNEESELKKIGYQITGSTKEKRWITLEKAVKELGLKRVAYTIAQHVKLRKGQKNGEKKFIYSITEWEYDLAKLKKHYYKNEFTWPSTKLTK